MKKTAYARGAFCRIALALGCVALLSLPVQAAEMTVSAAASLTNAFNEIKGVFEKKHTGLQVHTNYAASNPLLKQIQEGAPVDVFASADQATMDKAVAAKVVDPATRKDCALNDLVLIVPAGSKKPAKLEDIKAFKRVAIGNPDSVPAGRYTKDALNTAKLWEAVQPQLILGNSVRQVLDYVARGEVDAGFVYRTDAKQLAEKVEVVMIVEGHDPVSYPIAVATTGKDAKMGQEFLNFVLSPEGQAVLAKYGFSKP